MDYKQIRLIEIMERISSIIKNPFIVPQRKQILVETLRKEMVQLREKDKDE